jgi:hypothetical protein
VIIVIPLLLLLAADPAVSLHSAPIETGFRQMYDLQFDEAHQSFEQWMREHPEDPMGPASDAAAYLFSEFNRLHILQSELFLHDDTFLNHKKPAPDANIKQKFEDALQRTEALAERALAKQPLNLDAQFANLMRFGLHSDYLALIEKKYVASLTEVKASRAIAEKLLAAHPDLADAYLAVGVENYLLSLKPAPLRWFLRIGGAETDKQAGIADLSITAAHGNLFLPYARILLAVAALRDRDKTKARELLEGLAREFPDNPLYRQELARLH